ncbi:bifunctional farnesyl-diphosphate farnesyltransferase/squalene synthase [Ascoidea rubescens DSM 1968]|uniref:Squalene synthase n=1 Tax=Ascoidea rubescens DSM 1968 TaxID=1344418 RepID=A0A1D2VA77_9ASCO|nr:farnesyl-diphosphate farnesyltransferase [Ascoidea rubescens DSM 1968]ODV58586.1 farnesyl-diphosphate farnesyltransferase [Ascoidea rubescens DSM 1968]
MGKLGEILAHPCELISMIHLKAFRKNVPIDLSKESKETKLCYDLLKKTSRSFALVVIELHPELRDAVMLFYLILRALDTVEDDMTIEPKIKIPLLKSFSEKLELTDWTFDGNSIKEKDRIVLINFDSILKVFHSNIKRKYQDVIKRITYKMGNGMARYILDEEFNLNGVKTVKDYDLYCHYVAGLVGEGLTNLFVLAKFSNPLLNDKMDLAESMGLFLQKTNIIRDLEEDLRDGRSFYPKEIWSKYCDKLPDLLLEKNVDKLLNCTSDLILNALGHVIDVLDFLSLINEQNCFNFCAIPQVMAIATLDLLYQNKELQKKTVKIRRGTTCYLILKSRTLKGVTEIFSGYIKSIHHKSKPDDPNYLKIGILCGKIEQFIESMYPFKNLPKELSEINYKPTETAIFRQVQDRDPLDVKMFKIIEQEEASLKLSLLGVGFSFLIIGYLIFGDIDVCNTFSSTVSSTVSKIIHQEL